MRENNSGYSMYQWTKRVSTASLLGSGAGLCTYYLTNSVIGTAGLVILWFLAGYRFSKYENTSVNENPWAIPFVIISIIMLLLSLPLSNDWKIILTVTFAGYGLFASTLES